MPDQSPHAPDPAPGAAPGAAHEPETPEAAAGIAALNQAAEGLWQTLSPRWPGLNLTVLPTTPSTSTVARDMADPGSDGPCVVVAWRQTAGRGRHGRHWEARPGHSLTLSLALPMALTQVPGGGGSLSLAVGLWVAQALDALRAPACPPIGLKWPNDLWVDDRKLGGILIEASPRPDGRHWVVIGLGLNLQGTPPELVAERCDLAALHCPLTPAQALSTVMPALLTGLDRFRHEGFAPWHAAWEARDVLAGRPIARLGLPHTPGTDAGPATGVARGVRIDGALRVEPHQISPTAQTDAPGTLEYWVSGEVSVRPLR